MTSHDCAGYTFVFDLEKNISGCSSKVGTSYMWHTVTLSTEKGLSFLLKLMRLTYD